MTLKGHCLCKAVTYTADVDKPLLTGYDHCDDCQRQSGSTYSKCPIIHRVHSVISSQFSNYPIPVSIPPMTPLSNVINPP